MAKISITSEENVEVQRLWAELPAAYGRAAAALRTDGAPLEGAALRKFIEEDAKARAIVHRIKEILGIAGQPWSA